MSLPPEILEKILLVVQYQADPSRRGPVLASLALVCKEWLPEVRRALYQSLYLGNRWTTPAHTMTLLVRTLSTSPSLASLVREVDAHRSQGLGRYTLFVLAEAITLCPNIRRLKVHTTGYHDDEKDALLHALRSCSSLEHLKLTMLSLDLEDKASFTIDELWNMLQSWPQIAYINVGSSMGPSVTPPDRAVVPSIVCSHLRQFSTGIRLDDAQLVTLSHVAPSLSELETVCHPTRMTDHGLGAALRIWTPTLAILRLTPTQFQDGPSYPHHAMGGFDAYTISSVISSLEAVQILEVPADYIQPQHLSRRLKKLTHLTYNCMRDAFASGLLTALDQDDTLLALRVLTLPTAHFDGAAADSGAWRRVDWDPSLRRALKAVCETRGIRLYFEGTGGYF
ncbi:hypothetical protein BV25DRAFT_1919172 [Artomyces pyxidatus]|uniref:Uncharacterized protein n=1 Tax=Artomyces pyxidatus TaxID=48021 RepID=A0ACB8SR41_9AGAM|nr:hypothetical protein BV25DRAFT_1919172 [Artomyces pyxidatus]